MLAEVAQVKLNRLVLPELTSALLKGLYSLIRKIPEEGRNVSDIQLCR
jgi:hypothetical protein